MNDIELDFQKQLEAHDWFFMGAERTEDYLRGKTNEARLEALAERDPVLQTMWREACRQRVDEILRAAGGPQP